MKKGIAIVFAFVHLLLVFGCSKANAITSNTITIEDVEYSITAEMPYVVVVPESVEVGKSDTVYVAGFINGSVTLSAPSTVTLSQSGVSSNKISCTVAMGTGNKLTLVTSPKPQIISENITIEFKNDTPLTGAWSGNITYTLTENLIKDVTEYLEFTLSDDGTYYIISSVTDTGILDYCNNNLVLPSTYNGKPVRKIGEKLFYAGSGGVMQNTAKQKGAITVTIPDTITTIGSYAFSYFGGEGTKFIIEGSNLKTIERNAFNRSYLNSINLPDSITEIGEDAFAYCTKLTSVNIPKSLTGLGAWAFNNCSELTGNIVLPSTLTEMGQNVFKSCKKITSVQWECKLSAIPYGSFHTCSALKSFSMSTATEGLLKEIKGYAFYNCKALTSFEFPSCVTEIANYAFYNSGLNKATYPASASTYARSFPSSCTLNPV